MQMKTSYILSTKIEPKAVGLQNFCKLRMVTSDLPANSQWVHSGQNTHLPVQSAHPSTPRSLGISWRHSRKLLQSKSRNPGAPVIDLQSSCLTAVHNREVWGEVDCSVEKSLRSARRKCQVQSLASPFKRLSGTKEGRPLWLGQSRVDRRLSVRNRQPWLYLQFKCFKRTVMKMGGGGTQQQPLENLKRAFSTLSEAMPL